MNQGHLFEVEIAPGVFQPVLAFVREQYLKLRINEKSEEQRCELSEGDFDLEPNYERNY